ncbi:MAG: DUF72 domain-containing protein [Candidatus Eisenbacteria bacterium]|nr:DUF72 domain-containing protein [Candidatus Eisenbacteria bacterium]
MTDSPNPAPGPSVFSIDRSAIPTGLYPGTSSWSADDWKGTVYEANARPGDYIAQYARHFGTVEIDATFYRIPNESTVDGWREKTPDEFCFSAKIPQVITHEKFLEDCLDDFRLFVGRMERLKGKLGPMVFQFPYVAKGKDAEEYETGRIFRERLGRFLKELPTDHRFAVEIRNEKWLDESFVELLRSHQVALVLVDYFTMPSITKLVSKLDPVTANFSYIRFLGDHKRMDALVKDRDRPWGSLAVDRTAETVRWVPVVRDLLSRKLDVFAYFNNHFAGYAPGSARLFLDLLRETP